MFVIAGVSGHVGGVAASELLSRGEKVKVIVRDGAKGHEWSKRGAEVTVGSLEDPAFLASAFKGATGAFVLLPPNLGAADPYAWQRTTASAIANAVKDAKVPHVVMLSSIGADLDAGNGPIKGLHFLENALRATGTTLTAIRAGFFQENIGTVLGAAQNAGIYPNFTPSADYPMPMIATKDIGKLVAAELQAKPTKSSVIDLHGPTYSIRQLAEKLGKALKKNLNVVDVPPAAHVETLTQAGLPKPMAEAYAEMYAGFATGKIVPKGDRAEKGTTEIDEVIKTLVPN